MAAREYPFNWKLWEGRFKFSTPIPGRITKTHLLYPDCSFLSPLLLSCSMSAHVRRNPLCKKNMQSVAFALFI